MLWHFFAFLRIGEITVSTRDSVNGNRLQLHQVSKNIVGMAMWFP